MHKKLHLNQRVMSTGWFMHNAEFSQKQKSVGEAKQRDGRGIYNGENLPMCFIRYLHKQKKKKSYFAYSR